MSDFVKADDPTGRIEKNIEAASRKYLDIVELGARVLNRAIGAEVASRKEQKQRYEAIKNDVPQLTELKNRFIAMRGPQAGLKEYMEWVLLMEEKNGSAN